MMKRYFSTTGPCMPDMHYMLPPADRLIGASLDRCPEYRAKPWLKHLLHP